MALLERGELLQRQRVDLAEQGQVLLGLGGPLLLGRPGRTADGAAGPAPALAPRLGHLGAVGGTGSSGPYSADQGLRRRRRTPPAARASSCSIRSRCSARATSSRCTSAVSRSSSSASWRAVPRTVVSSASRPARAAMTASRCGASGGQRPTDLGHRHVGPGHDDLGDHGAPGPGRPSGRCPLAAPRARRRPAGPARRPDRTARRPAPRRCARPAGPRSRSAGRLARRRRARRVRRWSGRRRPGCVSAPQPLLELGQAGQVAVAGLLGPDPGLVEPVGLGRGRAGRRAELGQPAGGRVAVALRPLAGRTRPAAIASLARGLLGPRGRPAGRAARSTPALGLGLTRAGPRRPPPAPR